MQPEFCSLTHLVKLDLSKNQLTSLPDDLGNLVNLQHLDLYNNKLTVLPVSFSQLRVGGHVGFFYIWPCKVNPVGLVLFSKCVFLCSGSEVVGPEG